MKYNRNLLRSFAIIASASAGHTLCAQMLTNSVGASAIGDVSSNIASSFGSVPQNTNPSAILAFPQPEPDRSVLQGPGPRPRQNYTQPQRPRQGATAPTPAPIVSNDRADHPLVNALLMPSDAGWNFTMAAGYNSDLLARGVGMIGKNTFNDTARDIHRNWDKVITADLVNAGLIDKEDISPGFEIPEDPNFVNPDKTDTAVSLFALSASKDKWTLGMQYVRSLSSDLVPFYESSFDNTDAYEEFRFSVAYNHSLIADNWLNGYAKLDFVLYPNEAFWGVSHQGLLTVGLSVDRYEYISPYVNLFYNIATDTSGGDAKLGAEGADLVKGYGATVGARGSRKLLTLQGNGTPDITIGLVYDVNITAKFDYFSEQEGLTSYGVALMLPITIGSNLVVTPSVQYVGAFDNLDPSDRGFERQAYGDEFNDPGVIWGVNVRYAF
jgi:hypothetical protein